MLETSSAIAMAPVHGAALTPKPVSHPRVMTLGMQHLSCFGLMTSEAFTTTNQRAFSDKSSQSGLINDTRYPKARPNNNEERDRHATVDASKSAAKVVGGSNHFMSAYRRFFDNPESHLFPTDYSPARAAAAGGGGMESPSHGSSHVLADPPPTFESNNQRAYPEHPAEYLHQHPLRTFTTSRHSALSQDRCYRTAPAQGVPVLEDCSLGDKFAYIRDGTGGYITAEVSVDPDAFKEAKGGARQQDHMFGAVQVEDQETLSGRQSGACVAPRRWQNLPPVGTGFTTSNSAAYKAPQLGLEQLNEIAKERTAAFIADGSVMRKREVAYTLPGIFHRVNGIATIVREKEVQYQMRVAKGQIRTPPRAKVTSLTLEHEPLSVPVQLQ